MELQIEYLNIDEIKPYNRNTRKHTEKDIDKIKDSIRKYGFNDPLALWKDNIIIEGHGRLEASKELGMTEVPVIRLDHLTDEERREYAIAHNRTAEFSEWDMEMLEVEMSDLDFGDFDLEFDLDDINGDMVWKDQDEIDLDSEESKAKEHTCPSCGFKFYE